MEQDDSRGGVKHEVFIRKDYHRLFAVLRVDGREVQERLPLQIEKWDDTRRRWYLEKVIDRLIKQIGLGKAKVLKPLGSIH